MANERLEIFIIYDGECPFCSDFMAVANMRKAGYELKLVNARDKFHPAVLIVRRAGLNLDNGMVVLVGELVLYGADAAHFIISHGNPKAFRAKIYRMLLSRITIARILYPMLVILRKAYFSLTRRGLINE